MWSNRSNTLEARLPRCFGRVVDAGLCLYYESGKKVWMNSDNFIPIAMADILHHRQNPRSVCFIIRGQRVIKRNFYKHITIRTHSFRISTEEYQASFTALDLRMIACIKNRYKSMIAKRSMIYLASGYSETSYKIEIHEAGIWTCGILFRLQHDSFYNY